MKKKPPTGDTVINLQHVRERIEAEAKKTGETPADIFSKLFGAAYGLPTNPYGEAVQRQRDRATLDALEKAAGKALQPLSDALQQSQKNTERARKVGECLAEALDAQRAETVKANAHIEELWVKIDSLTEAIDAIDYRGDMIAAVIDALRRDHRMPKLTISEWELLLGDLIREERENQETVEKALAAAENARSEGGR